MAHGNVEKSTVFFTPPPAPPLKEGWGEAELGPLS